MSPHLPRFSLSLVLAFGLSSAALGEEVVDDSISTEYQSLKLTRLADGLENPWSLAFLPDGDMLVTERPGRLQRIRDGQTSEITGVPEVHVQNQGGLLEVSVHPDFDDNGWVYLTYSRANGNGETTTALGRGKLEDNELVDFEELFQQDRYSSPGRHYGSKLAWTLDGKLLMSIGDRGADPPRAQDLGDHAGTLLRLNADGSVPDDNPFVDDDEALPEIYSYGHRNIQGLLVHPETGEIWATEHGPRGGDELNHVRAGENYGWPRASKGLNYRTQEPYFEDTQRSVDGMVEPVIDWTPSLAASGLAYLPEDSVFSMWRGNLLAGGLRAEQIRRVHFIDDEPVHQEELLRGTIGRVRDVRVGPDGFIYVLSDESDGGLYRIEPAQ